MKEYLERLNGWSKIIITGLPLFIGGIVGYVRLEEQAHNTQALVTNVHEDVDRLVKPKIQELERVVAVQSANQARIEELLREIKAEIKELQRAVK